MNKLQQEIIEMKQLQEILKPYFAEWQTEVDITAVLKYICKYAKNYHITEDKIQWWDEWIDDYWNRYDYQIWETSNKPLHLYTEEENLQLLKLLKQLKNAQ